MMDRGEFFTRLRGYLPFAAMLILYFLIPLTLKSVPPPPWLLAPDRHIPFLWWMIVPYYWHYLLVAGVLFLPDLSEFHRTIRGLVWASLLIYAFFVVWPVEVVLLERIDVSLYPLSWMHRLVDLGYLRQNSFPAQHVVISGIIVLRVRDAFPRWAPACYLLLLGVFLSTFYTKQHYLWDSVAGLLLGLGFYRLYFGLPIWSISRYPMSGRKLDSPKTPPR